MRDSVELKLGNKSISDFESFSIESRMYEGASQFSLEVSNPGIDIAAGTRFELFVNYKLEMSGIVDRVIKGYNKGRRYLSIEGRDLMGLIVDSYCEQFITLEGKKLPAIAETLLKKVPFINRKAIEYDSKISKLDAAKELMQIEPGSTIFEALKGAALSRGLLFFCKPDGTLVFRKPKGDGPCIKSLVIKENSNESEIIDAELNEDFSQRYSKIVVLGQQQGSSDFDPSDVNVLATVADSSVPYYKACVRCVNEDKVNAQALARKLLEQQKAFAKSIRYTVHGFSQKGINWGINQLCRIDDDVLRLHGTFLIYNRAFRLSRNQGAVTVLELGDPGVVA